MLNQLHILERQGIIRSLDYQFARLIHSFDPDPLVTLAAANVSFELGLGNVCMPIESLELPSLFSLSIEDTAQLIYMTEKSVRSWVDSLAHSSVVGNGSEPTPLVLDNNRLYLYRYWQYERNVAHFLVQQHNSPLDQSAAKLILKRLFLRDYDFVSKQCAGKLEDDQKASISKWLDITDSSQLNWPAILDGIKSPESFKALDQLIPETHCLNWQKVAVALAATRSFSVISGGPGTGKTTTVTRLLALLMELGEHQNNFPDIKLVAPTGKAAARLTESIGGALKKLNCSEHIKSKIPTQAGTLHRLLGVNPNKAGFIHNKNNRLHLDILVVDEASMIDLPLMSHLMEALPENARLILLGDRDQLSSVEAGSVLGDICSAAGHGYSNEQTNLLELLTEHNLDAQPYKTLSPVADSFCLLKKSYRFDAHSGIGSLATAMNLGDASRLDTIFKEGFQDISCHSISNDGAYQQLIAQCVQSYRNYLNMIQAKAEPRQVLNAFNNFQLLCALRTGPSGVSGLNDAIESSLFEKGLITLNGQWYEGRPVLITKNDHGLGLYNGDIGITMRGADDRLRVVFETSDELVRELLPSRLPDHETVYAMTIHKSQGSEFADVVLALPDRDNQIISRELVYTGITRAKSMLTIYSDLTLLKKAAITPTMRQSGLLSRLYPLDFKLLPGGKRVNPCELTNSR